MVLTTTGLTARSYPNSQFHFNLEGEESFMVKSFEGGLPKGNVVEEPIGTTLKVIKHLSTFEIDPLTVEFGMQDGLPMLKWIRESWRSNFKRKDGTVRLADFNLMNVKEYNFTKALITETTFPTLDAAGKEGAMLKVKIQPEDGRLSNGDGQQIVGQSNSYQKQKLWTVNNFKLELERHDTTNVAKIEGFTVKQSVKGWATGRERFQAWEPTKLVFPDISFHMSMAYAAGMLKWYEDTCQALNNDPGLQTTGAITFLSPTLKEEIFQIKLSGVGLRGMTIDKAERGDGARRVKFDLYVSEMDLSV